MDSSAVATTTAIERKKGVAVNLHLVKLVMPAMVLLLTTAVIMSISAAAITFTPVSDLSNFDSDASDEDVVFDSAGGSFVFGLARRKKRRRTFKKGRPKRYDSPSDIPAGEAGIIQWRNDSPGIGRRIKAVVTNRNPNETYTGKATTDARKESHQQVRRGVADPSSGDYIRLQKAHGPRDNQQVDDIDAKESQKIRQRRPMNNDLNKGGVGRKPDHYKKGHLESDLSAKEKAAKKRRRQ